MHRIMIERINFTVEDKQKLLYKKAASVSGYWELGPWIRMVLDREVRRVAEQQGQEPIT